jgi:hypothetical protein
MTWQEHLLDSKRRTGQLASGPVACFWSAGDITRVCLRLHTLTEFTMIRAFDAEHQRQMQARLCAANI